MSIYLPQLKIDQFDSMVKAEFQSAGFLLRGTMQERRNVVGHRIRFQVMGSGIAKTKAPQDDVSLMNLNNSHVYATLVNYHASELTDIFDQQEVNFDDQKQLAKAVGMACGRRMDQIAIDALDASTTTNTIAHGSSGFTYAKFLKAIEIMDDNSVTGATRYLAITAKQQTDLLNETKLTSKDYIAKQHIQVGSLNGAVIGGFKIIVIPKMLEGGLPKTGTTRTCFAWHEFAAGYGIGIDFRTEISYQHMKTSHLVTGLFKAGATEVDKIGIVKIECTEAA